MLKYMDYAYAVYKEKSFSKAAEKLYISQPSLSLTIKKLEKEIGFPIFERSGKEITLTPIGEKYIKAIEEIMQIKTSFENELDDLFKLDKGRIFVGSTTFIASYILPDIIKSFSEKFPNIRIDIDVEQSTVLYEKLENGTYDIVIDNVVHKDDSYNYIPFFKEKIVLAIPSSFPVNSKLKKYVVTKEHFGKEIKISSVIDMKLLENEKFILLKPGNKMRDISDKIFAENGFSPDISLEFNQLMTSVNYARHDFGICFLTDTVIKYEKNSSNLTFYIPDTKYSERKVYIIHKKNKYMSTASKKFTEFLTEKN